MVELIQAIRLTPAVCWVLFLAVVVVYASSVRRMIEDEKPTARCALAAVVALGFAMRFWRPYDYPPGLYVDEPMHLIDGWRTFTGEYPAFGSVPRGAGIPSTGFAIIQGALWSVLPGWWAIRLHPMVCGVLSVVGAFAILRTMGRSVAAASVAAGAMAVLPWSVIYSRSSMGGEIFWHALLVLWAILRGCGRIEFAAIVVGVTLLQYDYFAGRSVLPIALAWIIIMHRSWPRWRFCFAALTVAIVLYVPSLPLATERVTWGYSMDYTTPMADWWDRFAVVVSATWRVIPGAFGWSGMTFPDFIWMPMPVIIAAAAGLLAAGPRRASALLCMFLGGVAPAVVSAGGLSSHRLMVGLLAIPLLAGCGVDLLPRLARPVAVVALAASLWSAVCNEALAEHLRLGCLAGSIDAFENDQDALLESGAH